MMRPFFRRLSTSFAATLCAGALILPAAVFAQAPEKKADPQPAASAKSDSPQKSGDKTAKPNDRKQDEKKPEGKKPEAKKPADTERPDRKPDAKRPDRESSDRESVAQAFAKEHHPELASLLRTLKTMSPRAYESAVRDVSRVAERLEGVKDRDPERYERELDVWKTRSRVHVVSAEYRLTPGADLEAKLRDLMKDELRAKRALLALDRERTARRLEQLDKDLGQIDEKGADMIDRQIERLPQSPASTSKSKPKPKTAPN